MKMLLLAMFSYVVFFFTANVTLAQGNTAPTVPGPDRPGLHARLFDTHLQQLSAACTGNDGKVACINGFWKIADVSGDGQLSVAEITRILRIVSGKFVHEDYAKEYEKFQSALTKGGPRIPPESEEAVVVFGIATTGPILSHAIIGNFDYNDNGLLSKSEVLHDIAVDITLSSVDTLPAEIKSRASRAVGLLLQFLMKE